MPRHDNTFGGGNYDADDIDEWLTIQRDWQVDGGIEPVAEAEVLRVRERAARAVQAVFAELGLPAGHRRRGRGGDDRATRARDLPDRDRAADVEAADELLARGVSALDVALALDRRGFDDVAEAIVGMQRQRVAADYLQTSAVIEPGRRSCAPPSTTRTRTSGPGTGYRLEGERWELLQALPHVVDPRHARRRPTARRPAVVETASVAAAGDDAGRGRDRASARPSRTAFRETINGLAARRRARRDRRRRPRGGRRAAARPRPPLRGRRVHRPRRRAPLGLRRRPRNPVEGDRGHPPRRPPAARQPRAVRHEPALHARELPGDGAQRRRLRAGPARRPRPDASSTTSRARSSSSRRRSCTRGRRAPSSRARPRSRCRSRAPPSR